MKKLFQLFIFISICHSTFGQFEVCNSNTENDLFDVYFINAQTGIAVGDNGTIIRSVDSGKNWTTIMELDSISFSKVKFFDAQNGITIGTTMYRTTDAGLSWTKVLHSNSDFYDIAILNDTTCLISGYPTSLIKSTNTGSSFMNMITTFNGNLGLLSFINDDVGYACNIKSGGIMPTMKTTDGGITWDTVAGELSGNTVMEAMVFVSENTGFKGGWYSPYFHKTSNGATTWNGMPYDDSLQSGQIYDFHIDKDMPYSFYACGWYGEVYKSIDYGNEWTAINSGLADTIALYGIYFVDDFKGWAVGKYGTIIRTTNGGEPLDIDNKHKTIVFEIYPNPAQDQLKIKVSDNIHIDKIDIIDISGKIIKTYNEATTLDVADIPRGNYILKVKSKEGIATEKIVIQ